MIARNKGAGTEKYLPKCQVIVKEFNDKHLGNE